MKSTLPVRRLIPKWRPVATTLREPEASSSKKKPSNEVALGVAADLEKAVSQWRAEQTPGFLGDVLAFSVHEEMIPRVLDVATEAHGLNTKMTSVQSVFINDLRHGGDFGNLLPLISSDASIEGHPFEQPVRRLRALLRAKPDNTLALLDMAQLQSSLGKSKAAERSIQTALSLAPNNRTVLRTAARYWVHAGKAERAHQLLRKHHRTSGDPWLMASEIAIADLIGTPSIFLSKGRRFLIDFNGLADTHITELAGAIASEELKSGNLKKARDAQRKALLSPNDNLISQAVENRQLFNIALEGVRIQRALANSHEAQVLNAWVDRRPDLIEMHAKAWHAEEPFSSRPIQFLSTLYLFQGEYALSERWLNAGLIADPQDRGLQTNMAFLKARAGQGAQMSSILRRLCAKYPNASETYALAIQGLYHYSQARFEVGDRMYEDAVREFSHIRRLDLASYCRVFQALYALEFKHPRSQEIIERAKKDLQIASSPDSLLLISIHAKLDLKVETPTLDSATRRMTQLVFDRDQNTLTIRDGLTAIGAKSLIVKERGS
jgi:tetratricopeptide (TPR) repeat protein